MYLRLIPQGAVATQLCPGLVSAALSGRGIRLCESTRIRSSLMSVQQTEHLNYPYGCQTAITLMRLLRNLGVWIVRHMSKSCAAYVINLFDICRKRVRHMSHMFMAFVKKVFDICHTLA